MIPLPDDCLWQVHSFLRWRERTKPVSKTWIRAGLRRTRRLRQWYKQKRVYSYLKHFGPAFVGISWHRFCALSGITRRKRNRHLRLTWRAAASHHINHPCKCQSCGCRTNAYIPHEDVTLCAYCRRNSKFRYAYMIPMYEALELFPRRVIAKVPYYRSFRCHLRFYYKLVDADNVS